MQTKEEIRQYRKLYRDSHKKEAQYRRGLYYASHKNMIVKRNKKRHLEIKAFVLGHYGSGIPCCVLCGESDLRCLSLDHINGGGTQHRKITHSGGGINFYYWIIRNNLPDGFRTLCMNCQWKSRWGN